MKHAALCIFGVILFYILASAQEQGYNLIHTLRSPDTAVINADLKKARQQALKSPDSALVLLTNTLQDSRLISYHDGIIQSLAFSGGIFIEKGMYKDGLRVLQEAVLYAQVTRQGMIHLASVYSWMAEIYDRTGNYEKALQCLYECLASARIPGSTFSLALAYNNLGLLFYHAMKANRGWQGIRALPYMDSAERISREEGKPQMLALVLSNKGTVYKALENYPASEQNLLAALELARKYGNTTVLHGTLVNLGELYLLQKQPHKAIEYLREVVENEGHVAASRKHVALHTLGVAYYELKRYRLAETRLLEALDGYTRLDMRSNQLSIREMFTELYRTTGRFREALEHREAYMMLKDSIAGENVVKQIHRMEIQYQATEKDKEIVSQQLQITHQTRNLERKNFWIMLTGSLSFMTAVLLVMIFRNYRNRQSLQQNQIKMLRQEQNLLHQEKKLERMKALIEGEENERARIARALHDGIAAQLAVIKMYINRARKNMRDLEHSEDFLFAIRQLDETATELRKTAHNLMPEVLLHHGLFEAVEIFCEKMSQGDTLRINCQHYGTLPPLSPEFELSLYRIIQELVQNIVKHAGATYALVQLNCYDNKILGITVEDNGKGMTGEHAGEKGTGLKHIAGRIKELNGKLDIRNGNPGTNIYMEIDLHHLNLPAVTPLPEENNIIHV